MTNICCTEYGKKDLFGAIIGLARSVEGNKNRPNEVTHKALLLGLRMFTCYKEYSYQEIKKHIEVLHSEKFKLVNRCLTCTNPCGRNDDYEVEKLEDLEPEVKQWKYTLLSSIMSMEQVLRNIPTDKCYYDQAIMFLYNALFIIGAECDKKKICEILSNGGEVYQKIFTQYLSVCI